MIIESDTSILLLSRLPLHGEFLRKNLETQYAVDWIGKDIRSMGLFSSLFVLFYELMRSIYFFRKKYYRIILVQFVSFDGFVALILRSFFKNKVVYYAIGSDILKMSGNPILYPFLRFLLLRCDFVFCANTLIKNKLVTMGVECSKLEVIGSIVNFDDFRISSTSKSVDIVTVGNLDANKNHISLIKACEHIGSLVKVSIVGDGPERSSLEQESVMRGVNVNFLGNIPHRLVFCELQKSKIYVHTAKSEGIPISFLEAIFCNLPLVVLDYPYISDLIDRFGFVFRIVEIDSSVKLAEAIKNVLNNYSSELGTAAANRRKLLSSISKNSSKFRERIDDLIAETPKI